LIFGFRMMNPVLSLRTLQGSLLQPCRAVSLRSCILGTVLLLSCAGLRAQEGGGTADQLLAEANQAFSAGDYEKAASVFSRFDKDFGSSPQAKPLMERVLSLWAYAEVRHKGYEAALPVIQRYRKEYPGTSEAREMAFWEGVCLAKSGDSDKAFKALGDFLRAWPKSPQRDNVLMLQAVCLFQDDKFKECADFLKTAKFQAPLLVSKASVLWFYCLLETGRLDEALEIVRETDVRSPDFTPLASFETLTLKLGSDFMEKDDYRRALYAFQRVWPRKKIEVRQQQRLDELRAAAESLKARPENAAEVMANDDAAAEIASELEKLKKMPDYDAALNLRIATCFLKLDRQREAYLVLRAEAERGGEGKLAEQIAFQELACLQAMGRWTEQVPATTAFLDRYPKSEQAPWALLLRAEAEQKRYDYAAAAKDFDTLATKHPKFPQAERAGFLAGYDLLSQEKYTEGRKRLERQLKEFPKGPFAEQARYWSAMALYFNKQYPEAREAFAAFMKACPQSAMSADAAYRRAHVLVIERDYTGAYKELEAMLAKYPKSERTDEALSLLGDSYFALGEMDRGMAAYKKVSKEQPRIYDYAAFRIGQAYKALEEPDAMLAHYQAYIKERPGSPRVVEALYNIAWVYRQQDKGGEDKARALYWDAIKEHGNDPEQVAVEEMLSGLAKLYKGPDERLKLSVQLGDLAEEAEGRKEKILAARALWARSKLQQKEDPARAQATMIQAAALFAPDAASPNLLADAGDAFRAKGDPGQAVVMYQGLLMWHPRSLQRDRGYAGMGLVALAQGKEKAALDWFDLFEKETIQSPLRAEVLKARAGLYEKRGQFEEAVEQLDELLKLPTARGLPWVEALYQMGEIRIKQGDYKKAIPCFQRIYVMYGRWTDYVAKAYWESGQAFERLGMKAEALNTYKEFIGNDQLKETAEYGKAKERLKAMGGAS
jgi:tetratricopeptide (TPR) repeat protein